jgi:RNA polymerase sigma factor (sigma-70 family)
MWRGSDRPKFSKRVGKTSDNPGFGKSWLEDFLASRPLLRRVVGRLVKPEEIEDIVQETFVLTYAASRTRKIDNPGAFMLTTARNIALNMLKRADMKKHMSLEDMSDEDLLRDAASIEDACQAEEMFLYFCRAVARLPVDCRRVFILRKVYGLSQIEVAETLGISASTVEKHVAKGMAMTGKHMVAKGYWDESASGVVAASRDEEAFKP